ncbi:hypothetical protein [Streptomyces sp. NPDC003077]|uniref:hypothetical protein n=1 Tax=Streptomyces sp. NPDC003077 TaxID=3154443 RepID=UPI0033A51726
MAGFGIAALLWGALSIIGGADSPFFPWLLVIVGVVALLAANRWHGPRRHPGENGSVIEERHYFGDHAPPEHERHW